MNKVTFKKRLEARERPNEKPIMHQDWRHLLFLHWECESEAIQKTLPPGLSVDCYENKSYLTIAVFFMENVRMAGMPGIPGFSDFIEINFRTYVYDKNGIPGVWFYSLELNSSLGVAAARQAFALPYHYAELRGSIGKTVHIYGKRTEGSTSSLNFNYQPDFNYRHAEPKTLDFFLIERYVLFSFSANELFIGRVNHIPYPISTVAVSKWDNPLFGLNGFAEPQRPPEAIHYSPGVDVDIFKLKNASFG